MKTLMKPVVKSIPVTELKPGHRVLFVDEMGGVDLELVNIVWSQPGYTSVRFENRGVAQYGNTTYGIASSVPRQIQILTFEEA
jgi:hypothetical protein